jgi:hypothetical protein
MFILDSLNALEWLCYHEQDTGIKDKNLTFKELLQQGAGGMANQFWKV